MKIKIYKIGRIVLIFLITATILHAFIQSALPPETSSAESNKVGEILEEIIPSDTPTGEFVHTNLRKLAHFTEFFALGVFTTLYLLIYIRNKTFFFAHAPFGIFIGLLDETVQIFSGRGPSVKDVWIDTAGYVSAAAVTVCLWYLVIYAKRFFKKMKVNN